MAWRHAAALCIIAHHGTIVLARVICKERSSQLLCFPRWPKTLIQEQIMCLVNLCPSSHGKWQVMTFF